MHQRRTRGSRMPLTRLRAIDPWGPVLVAVGLVVFLLHGFGGFLSRDLGLYAYAGQQFAEGVPPYVAVLNRAGPLAHMVPGFGALLARLLGTDDLVTMRALMLVLTLVAVWLVYILGRDLFGSRYAGAVAAVSLIAFRAVIIYSTGGPREKTTMMLLVICTLLAVRHRRWGWAGAATALATLTWQPAFWLCLTVALVAAAEPTWRETWRRTLRSWSRFALGGALATGAVVGYFVAVGALDAFFEGFLFVNATSTRQVGLVEFVTLLPSEMLDAFGWSLWLVLAGLVATLPLAWRARAGVDPRARTVVAVGVGTLVSAGWSAFVFNGWADAVFVLPLAAVGLAGAVAGVARSLPGRYAVVVTTAYLVLVPVLAGVTTWLNRPDDLAPMRREVAAVLEVTGPGTTVQSIGAPQPLVLGGLTNASRHQMFLGGLQEYVDDTYPGGITGFAADIEKHRPTFITMDKPTWYDWMRPELRANYTYVGGTLGISWYADDDIGEQRLERLEKVLDRGP